MRFRITKILIFFVLALFSQIAVQAQAQRGNVNFIVVSDLGAFGGGDQLQVAQQLGSAAESFQPTAILNLGDTFHFWGVQSVDDPGWTSNFESIYTNPMLHNLWYCALGNHDYQGNTQALIDYTDKSRRWNMPAHYHSHTFKGRGTTVEVIFIDSTPFLRRATGQPDIYPDACLQDTAAQTAWLGERLAQSTADWLIVAAHHPVYSARPDNAHQRADIQEHILPVLAAHRPDAYIAGDVHCFEHFQKDKDTTDYYTCSSGAKAYPVDKDKDALFASGESGYITIAAWPDHLTMTMYDKFGNQLYTHTRQKQQPAPTTQRPTPIQ